MKILHFADLHLGVETYGKTDTATGLSTRFIDFLNAFDKLVDYALSNKVDLVLFSGDAYKSREPSQTQQRELARRISRLSAGGVPVFLLVGNHDLPNSTGRATSTEIFDTLAVDNVYVSGRPDVYRIKTPSGEMQVASLPWLRRSWLMAQLNKEEIKNLSFEDINRRLEEKLTMLISDLAAKLDSSLPAVLAAHVWVAGAKTGSEKMTTIGTEQTLLPGNVALPAFDYVALGHIHKQQVLQKEGPPMVYSGSLERLDFGEEEAEKGFYVVDITSDENGNHKVDYHFEPVIGRHFLTIRVDVPDEDTDPTGTVLAEVNKHKDELKDAIVRLLVSLPAEAEAKMRNDDIRRSLEETHYSSIARDIKKVSRLRLEQAAAEEITPAQALEAYVKDRKFSPKHARLVQEEGEKLIKNLLSAQPDMFNNSVMQ